MGENSTAQQMIPLQHFQRETYSLAIFASSYEAQLPQRLCITFASLRWRNNGEGKKKHWNIRYLHWNTEDTEDTIVSSPASIDRNMDWLSDAQWPFAILVVRNLCYVVSCSTNAKVSKEHRRPDEQNRTVEFIFPAQGSGVFLDCRKSATCVHLVEGRLKNSEDS